MLRRYLSFVKSTLASNGSRSGKNSRNGNESSERVTKTNPLEVKCERITVSFVRVFTFSLIKIFLEPIGGISPTVPCHPRISLFLQGSTSWTLGWCLPHKIGSVQSRKVLSRSFWQTVLLDLWNAMPLSIKIVRKRPIRMWWADLALTNL